MSNATWIATVTTVGSWALIIGVIATGLTVVAYGLAWLGRRMDGHSARQEGVNLARYHRAYQARERER